MLKAVEVFRELIKAWSSRSKAGHIFGPQLDKRQYVKIILFEVVMVQYFLKQH